jgi:hypothetical protein
MEFKNSNPTVGQFVDVLKSSIINCVTFRGPVELIVKMMVLLFWITYSHCSGKLILLRQIPPQVVARKHVMMALRVSMLLNKYRRT